MSEKQPWKFFLLQKLNFQSLELNFQFLEGNFKMSEPCVGSRTIRLTEREFLVYALLAYLRQEGRGENGFVRLEEITLADLDTVFRRLTAARGRTYGLKDYEYIPRFTFIASLAQQLESKNARDRADLTRTFQETISRIKHKCEAKQLPERYFITTLGERGALRYGLRITPRHIVWNEEDLLSAHS
jgi:hypothetical protein